jgi:dinuclear metal center YbgI/SA1388 family protein
LTAIAVVELKTLVTYLNRLLKPEAFKDYCPNGLQVAGNATVTTLVTGVSANQELIQAAIDKKAQAILVHHGFFWKNEPMCLVGMKYNRIKALLANDISLIAYHLPLDTHSLYGNNIQLGKWLDIVKIHAWEVEPGLDLMCMGFLQEPTEAKSLTNLLAVKLLREPLHVAAIGKAISKIAWCTGAGQDFIWQAIEQQADAYLTGEVSERTVHIARENNIHLYGAGHHATERYGVKALGEHLSTLFQLSHHFIDIDNPV